MSLTAAELRAVYSVDEGPLDRSLSGMGGKVSSTFGKVAAAAAGFFAFDKLADGFFSVTGAASDLEGTISKSTAIFGANAGAIDQWAKGAAANLGLSRQQALASAAGFGDMFSQIGFGATQAADMSKAVVQMSADLGAFNDLPTDDVAQRISAAFRGEYDSLQALIPNINAARVESEAMAATGKKVASELTAQEKAAAVLAIVNKDGARAIGAFAREADSAAGSAKTANALWLDQKAAIGEQLLPAFTALMGFLSGTVIPGVGRLADFIGGDVVPALKDMAEWVQANETPVRIIAGLVGGFLVAALSVWAARTVASAATNTVAWFTTAAASSTSAAAQSKSAAQVVTGWLLMGAQALLHGLKVAAVWTAQIVASAVTGAASFAAQVARVVAGWVLMGAQALAQGVKIAAVWTAQIIASAVAGAVSFGIQVALVVAGWVLMATQSLIQAARMAAAWFIALGPVGWVIAAVIGLVALIIANWDTIVSWTQNAWDSVTGFISDAWNSITGFVQSGVDAVMGVIGWFAELPGKVAGWFGGVKDAALRKMGELVSWLGGLPGEVLSAIGDFGLLLLDAGADLLEGLWDGISGAASWLKDKILDWAGNLLPGWVKDILGINSPSTVFAEIGRYLMLGMAGGIDAEAKTAVTAAVRAAAAITDAMQVQAPDLMGLADQQAMAGLTARRPVGMSTGAGAAGQPGTTGGGIGELVHIDNYHEAPGSSAYGTANALAIEARTRGWAG